MSVRLTPTQAQRLRELGGGGLLEQEFAAAAERDEAFRAAERELASAGRRALAELRAGPRSPRLRLLEADLRAALTGAGVVEMVTPAIISADALRRMGIETGHPLAEQVFWLEGDRCLRPMLAPGLYTLLRRLARIWSQPFALFEVGSCWRRDTKGSQHLTEFTMLNVVELGTEMDGRRARLDGLAALVMDAAGIADYELEATDSEVYGETLDILVGGLEVCSTAVGPLPLDDAWGITDPWVGLGFGLERLLTAREGYPDVGRAGRSLSYVDGVRLQL